MANNTAPAVRFREAIPTASLAHLRRLAARVGDIRNADSSSRKTSIVEAAEAGRLDVVDWLIEEGHEELEISRDSAGDTLLHAAAALGYVGILELYLTSYSFVVDWVNVHGATPLHVAAMKGEVETVQLLAEYGADINAPDLQGNTPLHYASSWGHTEVVRVLIDLGCQSGAKNNEGFTAAEYAFSFQVKAALEAHAKAHREHSKENRRRSRAARLETSSKSDSNGNAGLGFNLDTQAGASVDMSSSPPSVSMMGLDLGSHSDVDSPIASTSAWMLTPAARSPIVTTGLNRNYSIVSNTTSIPLSPLEGTHRPMLEPMPHYSPSLRSNSPTSYRPEPSPIPPEVSPLHSRSSSPYFPPTSRPASPLKLSKPLPEPLPSPSPTPYVFPPMLPTKSPLIDRTPSTSSAGGGEKFSRKGSSAGETDSVVEQRRGSRMARAFGLGKKKE